MSKPTKEKAKERSIVVQVEQLEQLVKHVIDSRTMMSVMLKAGVPSRFVRTEVKLSSFPWGKRMKDWLDNEFFNTAKSGKSMFLAGPADQAMPVCAMLTRSLVMRSKDADITPALHEYGRKRGWEGNAGTVTNQFSESERLAVDAKIPDKLRFENRLHPPSGILTYTTANIPGTLAN